MWFLCLFLFLSSLLLITKGLKLARKNNHLPPGPPKLPIIGNLHQLGALPHRSLYQLSRKYGPVMLLKLGFVPTIVISSADAAKEVLKVHDLACCSRPHTAGTGKLSYNHLDISFSPYGDHWREVRKICTLELFSVRRVQSFWFVREAEIDLLMKSISHVSSSGTEVDLSEKLFSLAATITSRVAFGKSFRGSDLDNENFQEVIRRAVDVIGSFCVSDFFPLGWIIDRITGFHSILERSFSELDTYFQRVLDDHLNSSGRTKENSKDVIDVLLKIVSDCSELDAVKLSRDCIKAIIMDIFLAGVDTGAVTTIWAMTELARNPRVMKKAQDEIRSSVKNSKVNEIDIDQFQYLKMIVKETLRLHPPVPLLLPRETISTFKLNGYNIEPKTRIHVNVWAIGRDSDYWENPEEFFPERFIDSCIDYKGQHFELLPFGAGRRGCPGMYMGTSLVEITLANLLFWFDWKLPDGMKEEDIDMEELCSLTVPKKTALKLVPVKYQRV